jgi:cytochrome b6-f complex iron-sulfur subunit
MRNVFRFATTAVAGLGFARLASAISRFNAAAGAKVSRRNFTRNAVLGGVALNLGLLGAGFVRFFWPNKTGAFGSALTIPASSVPDVGGTPFQYALGKFYVVHNEDGLLALYWKCPHLGCTVPWMPNSEDFRCPCHGSIYDFNGIVLGGPAPRPLDRMAIAVQPNGDIVVDTGAITQRDPDYSPDEATPYEF